MIELAHVLGREAAKTKFNRAKIVASILRLPGIEHVWVAIYAFVDSILISSVVSAKTPLPGIAWTRSMQGGYPSRDSGGRPAAVPMYISLLSLVNERSTRRCSIHVD